MSPPQRNILVLSFVDLINIQIEEEEAKIHYNRLNIHRSARAHVARAKMFFFDNWRQCRDCDELMCTI